MKKSKLKSKKAKVCLVSLGIPRGNPERNEGQRKSQNFPPKADQPMAEKTFNFLVVVFTFYFLLFPFICFAQPISSAVLINNAKEYDGKIVSYQGEVIGDVMYRGDFACPDCIYPKVGAWVNVNDGLNAIGIWIDKDLASNITLTGSYKFIGDTIFVEGKFNRSCLQHGGDLDIHANSLTIVEKGRAVKEKISIQKIIASLAFLAIVLFLGLLRLLRKGIKKR